MTTPTPQANVTSRARKSAEKTNLVVPGPAHIEPGDLYINRELSLLAFQRRVFREAQNPRNPLLERVKFVSILGSNIDEFFMVRVASLCQQIETRNLELSLDGKPPGVQLELIRQEITGLMDEIYKLWR